MKTIGSQNAALLALIRDALPYLPTCSDKEGEDCGPAINYRQRCLYMKARAAIARAKERDAGANEECPDGTDCPCFQAGYETQREPLR